MVMAIDYIPMNLNIVIIIMTFELMVIRNTFYITSVTIYPIYGSKFCDVRVHL